MTDFDVIYLTITSLLGNKLIFIATKREMVGQFATKTQISSPRNLSNYPHEFYSLRPLSISAQQSTESSLLQFCLKPNLSERFRISNNFPRDTSLSLIQLFSDNQFIQGFLRLINRKPKLRGVLLNRLTGKKFTRFKPFSRLTMATAADE